MPRGERPLDDGDTPLLRFAADLRKLRADAGSPTYRQLARVTHFSVTTLSEAAAGRKLPGLDATLAYVRACGGDEEAWNQRWHEVAANRSKAKNTLCPYVGLSAFTREDADRFFGREKLTLALKQRLEVHDFVAVFGASGEGKSSLLRAGLAPYFQRTVVCTPGQHDLAEAIRTKPDLLIVDQFEELFTLCPDPHGYVRTLLDAGCKTAIAIRSDFYPRCAEHPGLAEAITDAQVLLGTMAPDELRRAITQPAAKAGCIVDGDLLTTLVAEAIGRSGVLPLVSHALMETWHRRKGTVLTLGAYRAAGGIDGALAQSAEAAYAQLSADRQRLARQLLLRLAADGAKRPVPRAEVVGDEVLDVLAGARLITVGEDTVEVTHEALFSAWPRLAAWLDENREGIRTHRRLTEAARLWQELDHDSSTLYRTTRLAEATEWVSRAEPALSTTEQAFLTASKHLSRKRSRRLKWVAAGLVAIMLVTVASAAVAFHQRAEVDRLGLVARSQQLAALSSALTNTSPGEAARKAAEAYRTYPTTEARGRVLSAAARRPREVRSHGAIKVRYRNGVIALGGPGGVRLLDAKTLGLTRLIPTGTTVSDLDLAPDGGIAVCEVNGRVTYRKNPDAEPVVVRRSGDYAAVRFTDLGLYVDGEIWDVSAAPRLRTDLPVRPSNTSFDIRGDTIAVVESTVTGAAGRGISFFSLTTGQRTGRLGVSIEAFDVRLLPGDRALVYARNGPTLWDTRTGVQIMTIPSPSRSSVVEVDGDGSVVAMAGFEATNELRRWDLVHNTALPSLQMTGFALDMAFIQDGGLALLDSRALWVWMPVTPEHPVAGPEADLSVAVNGALVTGSDRGVLTIRGVNFGEVHNGAVRALAVSPDKRWLATAGDDGLITVWDTSTWRKSGDLLGHTNAVTALAFSPDSQRLASGGADRSVIVWDFQAQQPWTALTGHTQGVTHVEWLPDGGTVVSAAPDGRMAWRLDVEEALRALD